MRKLKRCAENNIILNEEKKEKGLGETSFQGYRITQEGVEHDAIKVKSII